MNSLSKHVQSGSAAARWNLSESRPPDPVSLLPRIDLEEIINAFKRRLWIIIACMVLAVAAMAVYISRQPVLYASMGSLYVKTHAPQLLDVTPISQEEARELEQMRTVEQGLMSSTILLKLVDKHALDEDPVFSAGGIGKQALVETMRSRLAVELRRGTRLIDVTVEDTDPDRAAVLVEDLVTEYELWKDGGRNELIDKASAGLAREEARLRLRMESSEGRVRDFRTDHPLPGLSGGEDHVSAEFSMLNKEMTAARGERLRLESEYEAFRKFDPADRNSIAGLARGEHAELVLILTRQLGDKQAEFARIQQRYLHKHPAYIEAANEIQSIEKSLEEVCLTAGLALKKRYEVAVEHQAKLESLVAVARDNAVGAETIRGDLAKLKREAEVDRDLHASVAKRLQETQVGTSLTSSFLRWDERPFAADRPSAPRKKVLMAAGLMAGGLLGLILAVFAELLDRRVRESGAVARATGSPLLGTMPKLNPEAVAQLGVSGEGVPDGSQAMVLGDFSIPSGEPGEGATSLLFTSAFQGDGTSLCSLKCARMLAVQGHRTLLIDASMEDAGLSGDFLEQNSRRHGLAAFLMGGAEATKVISETSLSGLWFLPSGAAGGDSSEMLAKPAFKDLLENLAPMFDKIVVDGPSAEGVQAIARHLNSTCLVVRRGMGRYSDLRAATGLVRSAGGNLSGFVWNEVDYIAHGGRLPRVHAPAGFGETELQGDGASRLVVVG